MGGLVVENSPATARTRSVGCLWCGKGFAPSREWHRYCSDACRAEGHRSRPYLQTRLDFTPAPQPVPPVRDQRVPRERRPALGKKSRLIYERLLAGPVSNAELACMFPPATAWRTRLSDVRLWLKGQQMRMGSHDAGHGLWWHWIEEE